MEADRFLIPLDLSEWIDKSVLRSWVIDAIELWNWNNPELAVILKRHPAFEPKALFDTLTFAYLTSIFGSDEIARCCSTDPEFAELRPRLRPTEEELSLFRRLNRGLLKLSLAEVTLRAVRSQCLDSEMRLVPPGLRRAIINDAVMRLDIARHMDRSME